MSSRSSDGGPNTKPSFITGPLATGRGAANGALCVGGLNPIAVSTSAAGGSVACIDGDPASGGDVYINAGTGTIGQDHAGGEVDIDAGNATGDSKDGGNVSLKAGNGSGSGNGAGGDISIISGTAFSGTSNAGDISILSGSSASSDPASSGGDATLRSGNSNNGAAGTTTVSAGNGVTGGSVVLEAGTGTGDGGDIRLSPGAGATPGEINLNGNLKADADGIRFSANAGLTGTGPHIINFTPNLAAVPRCVQLTGAVVAGPTAFNVTSISTSQVQFTTSNSLLGNDVIYLQVIV